MCLINLAPHHEDVWGNAGIAPPFLISALGGGEWSASCIFHFIPRKRAQYPLDMKFDGPRAAPHALSRNKLFSPPGIECPAVQPVTLLTELNFVWA
jgi:hypothetical protein